MITWYDEFMRAEVAYRWSQAGPTRPYDHGFLPRAARGKLVFWRRANRLANEELAAVRASRIPTQRTSEPELQGR